MRYFSPSTVAFVLLAISLQAYSAPVVGKGDSPASPPLDQTPGVPVAVPASIPQQDEHGPHAHTGGPPHHHHHHHHHPTGGDPQDNNGVPPVPAALGHPQEQSAEDMHGLDAAGAPNAAIDTSQPKGSRSQRRANKAEEDAKNIFMPKNMRDGTDGTSGGPAGFEIHHRDLDTRDLKAHLQKAHAAAKTAGKKLMDKLHSNPQTTTTTEKTTAPEKTPETLPAENEAAGEFASEQSEAGSTTSPVVPGCIGASRRDLGALEARGERMDSLRDAIFGKPKPSTSATDPSQSLTSPTDTSAY
ncbi:hypothetical protein BDP27DRAFT_1416621 [Rhodocollybia butyracea]|uniref:Uncharacterized protein n=1 Tax=Rhodocollybia butyracea TaxID=206335 RepID=A0A9P5UD73_9AGAR|nr:hypothetical protein BDP27DRAFT_1416621 [Rhodocollybia butyracea]